MLTATTNPMPFGTFLLIGILSTALAIAYLMPTLLAAIAREEKLPLVFLVNLLFGWTVVGYLVAIGLAGFFAEPGERRIAVAPS